MQLQLSLTLADDLYDLLLMSGEPIDFLDAARHLLALRQSPESLCRCVMDTLATDDRRFCWASPTTIGLSDWRLTDPDLAEVAFVVVDLETTGMRPGLGKITEIGAVRIEGLRQVATFETLVNPQRSIPPKVVEITGITSSMLVGAPHIEEVMPHFLDFLDGAVIVAHNAPFDLSFLNYELSRLRGRRLGDGAIDTVPLSRCAAPGLANYKLGTVANALGSPVAASHRALADALATAHVFLTCVGRLQERDVTCLDELRSHIDPGHKRDGRKLALTRDIPREPGAYIFRDGDGSVLYVGKADRLRDRVRSYFLTNAGHSRKVRQAVRRLQQVDFETTGTPLRAVVREQELILEHRPSCNVFGRRPETYCYLKVGGRGAGLRLYASARPGSPGASAVLGPFRGGTRVKTAIELLQRTFPIRQCRGSGGRGSGVSGTGSEAPCLYGQTGRCLSPCSDASRRSEHDELVTSLLRWFTGSTPPALGDPLERAHMLMQRMSARRRYEEAQAIREAIDDLDTLRRSYQALAEARLLRTAVLWPVDGNGGSGQERCVHLDLVWDGTLCASARLDRSNAVQEIEKALRSLPMPEEDRVHTLTRASGDLTQRDRHPLRAAFAHGVQDATEEPALIAVSQDRLDLLLAVRGWIANAPASCLAPFPAEAGGEQTVETWRRELVAAARRLLED